MRSDEHLVRSFSDVGVDDVHSVGGKGANLGAMFSGGLPVPPGYCVTTSAYRRFIAMFADVALGCHARLDGWDAQAPVDSPPPQPLALHVLPQVG